VRQRFALGCVLAAFLTSAHAPKGTVTIMSFQFTPEELTVAPGDTVTWDNEDVFIHTVTADSGAWGSPELRRGQRYVLVPSDTGRFTYHCAAHAIMHGVLVVRR
jgi:plastocyanin